jgi:hypothetical protein
MPELTKTIRAWLGRGLKGQRSSEQSEAALDQLHGHMDETILDGFLHKTLDRPKHEAVINHLNICDPCREAIAVAILSVDNPKAAAELGLARKRRFEEQEPWQRQALRWSLLVTLALIVFAAAALSNQAKDPSSSVTRWLDQHATLNFWGSSHSTAQSDTSFGEVISSNIEMPKIPEPGPVHGSRIRQPGWDTGPAPYVGNVPPSAFYVAVDFPPETPGGAFSAASAPPPAAPAPDTTSQPAAPESGHPKARRRLVVTPTGELKRTLDAGESWQTIVINPALVFRSLALSGTTVWAAGNNGALYRSNDAAEHWQQVRVSYRGHALNENITEIDFSDPHHGFFRTGGDQVWRTVDGGQKWVLDPTTQARQSQ